MGVAAVHALASHPPKQQVGYLRLYNNMYRYIAVHSDISLKNSTEGVLRNRQGCGSRSALIFPPGSGSAFNIDPNS